MKAKYIWLIVLAVIAAIVASIVIVTCNKAAQTVGIVTDPNRMVYNYEWFYNTEADAKSYEQQIVEANKQVATFKADHPNDLDSYVNSTELSNLETVAQGLQNELVSTCNNYDAAAKDITRGIFKNWNLPSELTATSDGELIIVY
jgi:hypothetical protein